jgi:hypothetical protein
LDSFVPDIAFIEYVVNDSVIQDSVYTYTDALIFKLRKINPKINIVYVATTSKNHKNDILNNNEPKGVRLAREISDFNNVHFVDVGSKLWKSIIAEKVGYVDYLPDGIHPNDEGHNIYYKSLIEDLSIYLDKIADFNNSGSYLNGSDYGNATIEPATKILDTNCTMKGSYLECNVGETIEFNFNGTAIGFEQKIVSDGGRLVCTLDDLSSVSIDFWDNFALSFDRKGATVFFHNLNDTDHSLKCTVDNIILGSPEGNSLGQTTYISGIMVTIPFP